MNERIKAAMEVAALGPWRRSSGDAGPQSLMFGGLRSPHGDIINTLRDGLTDAVAELEAVKWLCHDWEAGYCQVNKVWFVAGGPTAPTAVELRALLEGK